MKTTATITIVGAGVIGAAIAYELSRALSAAIVVLEARSETEFAATGAALGVLIVQLSRRRGRNFQLRQASLARYDTLIPELEAATGVEIPYQRRGILEVLTTPEAAIATQSWLAIHSDPSLEWLEPAAVVSEFPMINPQVVHGALWAKGDRQVHPRRLTAALRQAAQQQGVEFWYHSKVLEVKQAGEQPLQLRLETGTLTTEYLILAAGLGTTPLAQQINHPVLLQPVLGQALEFGWAAPPTLPVLTAEDLHLVPVDPHRVWVGATVEGDRSTGDSQALATLREQASHLWPALKTAPLLRHWQGLRPRPCDRAAPVIEQLQPRVWVASGHYRNGILLAPITAQLVRQALEEHLAVGKGHKAQQPVSDPSENSDTKTSP